MADPITAAATAITAVFNYAAGVLAAPMVGMLGEGGAILAAKFAIKATLFTAANSATSPLTAPVACPGWEVSQ